VREKGGFRLLGANEFFGERYYHRGFQALLHSGILFVFIPHAVPITIPRREITNQKNNKIPTHFLLFFTLTTHFLQ